MYAMIWVSRANLKKAHKETYKLYKKGDLSMTLKSTILATAAVSVAAFGLTTIQSTTSAGAAETTLRGASCFPIGSPPSRAYEALVKEVNKRGKGVLQIKNIGGAPAIGSPFTLTQKMSRGAYDVVGCTEAYFGNVIPEAPVFRLSDKPYHDLRQNGGIGYLGKLLAKKNIHYVARHGDFGPFYLWLSKKIDSPNLKGLNLRVAPVYTAFFKSLGATVQTASLPQIYTLMENNTVQGYGWPAGAFVPPWAKVTKYQVKPGFYLSPLHTLVNLKKWKSLTDAQRNLITRVGLEFEKSTEPGNAKLAAHLKKSAAFRAKAGVKDIVFKGADRKKWLDAAYGAAWKEVLQRSPKHGKALENLFRN
jgi:TRAP-type transport system periplasmic protein